jgi:hypothetical protein
MVDSSGIGRIQLPRTEAGLGSLHNHILGPVVMQEGCSGFTGQTIEVLQNSQTWIEGHFIESALYQVGLRESYILLLGKRQIDFSGDSPQFLFQ